MSRAPLWLILLVAIVYARGLGGAPVYDDGMLMVDGTRIVMAGVKQAFTTDFWGVKPGAWRHTVYRPLATVAYSAIYHVFGLSPFAFHTASILVHGAATVALFYLVAGLGLGSGVALLAAALFAVHPLNVEAVSWMSALSEVISGACVFASLAFFVHGKRPLALLFAAAAMLTKEMSLALPALVFLVAQWGPGKEEGPGRWRSSLLAALPFALVAVCYVVIRSAILPPIPGERLAKEILNRLPILTGTAAHYLVVLFFPWPLSVHYLQPGELGRLAGAAVVVVWSAVLWRLPDRKNSLRLAAALAIVPLLIPVVHSTLMIDVLQMPDRNVYLAVAGASLTIALLLERLPARGMLFGGVLVLAIATILTEQQIKVWQGDESLWSHTLKVTPSSRQASLTLGMTFYIEKRFDEAAKVYRDALIYHPHDQEFEKLVRLAESQH